MARLIGSLNEGSLLRRTLIHVGTFALGSMAFIALASFLLVTAARAILPSHAEGAGEEAKEEAAAEEEATPDKKTTTAKSPRPSRRKTTEAAAPASRDSE